MTHARLLAWVREMAELTTPDEVVWVDGTDEEWERLTRKLVDAGTFTPLVQEFNAELAKAVQSFESERGVDVNVLDHAICASRGYP